MAKKVKGIFISEQDYEVLLHDMEIVVNHAKTLSSLFPDVTSSASLLTNSIGVDLSVILLGLQCRYTNYKHNGKVNA